MLMSQPYLSAYIRARLEEKCHKGEYAHIFNHTFENEVKANLEDISEAILHDPETVQVMDRYLEDHLRLYILNK